MKHYKLFIFLAALAFITGCSGSINIISEPGDGKTIVDGITSEWNNLTTIKNENIAVGFRNDSEFIYIAMVTNDRSKIMKILIGGLEIWLEPNDSDNKIGIRYPQRPDPSEIMRLREDRRNAQDQGDNTSPTDFLQTQKTIAIINEEGMVLKEFPVDGYSYQAKIKMSREEFAYELRIPISEDYESPDGLKAKTGENVSVEFITGSFMQDMMRRRDDGMGMPHGDGGGRMGGRGPGGQGGPGGMRQSNSGPLNFTFDVKLH